jgi:hypothetical protein
LIRFHSARFAGLLIRLRSVLLAELAGDDRLDVRRLGERRALFRFVELLKGYRRTALWVRGAKPMRR